jgi:hypothetical protein
MANETVIGHLAAESVQYGDDPATGLVAGGWINRYAS